MDITETPQFTVKEELTIIEEELNIAIKNEMEDDPVENPFVDGSIEVKQDFTQNEQDDINAQNIEHANAQAYAQNIDHDVTSTENHPDTQKDLDYEQIQKDNLKIEIEEETSENDPFIQTIHSHIEKDNLKTEIQIDNQNIDLHIEKETTELEINEENEMKQETESILPTNDDKMKEELDDGENDMNLISYEYPSFDDSMDSSEAAALFQVEACLSEETIKPDRDFDVSILRKT